MKQYSLNYLTDAFYTKYDLINFPEIENKKSRPYMVMLVKIEDNQFALPLRTNIKHKFCYQFKKSGRPTHSRTGIDFSKAIVINDIAYIGNSAQIDNKEYIELERNYFFIIHKFQNYIRGYKEYLNNPDDFYKAQAYKFTTLIRIR